MTIRFLRASVLVRAAIGPIAMLAVSAGSSTAQTTAAQKPAAAQSPAKAAEVLADIDGLGITNEEVEKALGANLAKLQEQIYNMKRQALDAIVQQRLLENEAAKRKISTTALIDAEVTSKVTLVTETEVEQYIEANKARLQAKGGDADQLRTQARGELQNQKLQKQRLAFLDSLKSKAKVAIRLTPPPVHRVDLNITGAPFKGPADAPITVVEFSDFHCPFCKKVEDDKTPEQLLARFGDKVKFVWLDYPIDQLHPQARKVHEAARCAGEQGKFWEYHKAAYTGGPKSGDQLTQIAQQTGLDKAKFDACVSSGKFQAAVQKDVDQAKGHGISGTPTFFVNGRMLVGAQPLDAFVRTIEDELARGKTTAAKSQQ